MTVVLLLRRNAVRLSQYLVRRVVLRAGFDQRLIAWCTVLPSYDYLYPDIS